MAKYLGCYLVGGVGLVVPEGMEPQKYFDAAAGQILQYCPELIPAHHKFVVGGGRTVRNLDGSDAGFASVPEIIRA